MLSNLKIGTRLSLCFAIITMIIIILGIVGYSGTEKLLVSVDHIANPHSALLELSQSSRAEINVMRRFEKDLFINIADTEKVEEYRKKWNDSRTHFNEQNEAMIKLVDSSEEKEALAAIKKLNDEYAAGFSNVCDQIRAGVITSTQDANKAIGQYKIPIHQAESLVINFSRKMRNDMDEVIKSAHGGGRNVKITIAIFSILAAILAIILSAIITRSITMPLSRLVSIAATITTGDLTSKIEVTSKDETGQLMAAMKAMNENLNVILGQMANNSNQVSSASDQLNITAEQTAAEAEEIAGQANTVATASEEIAAISRCIAKNCQTVAEDAHRASTAAQNGVDVVEKTVGVMLQIAEQVQAATKTVENLGARGDQIGAIISTIEDIADQTNLLALNAAIEAARAGEQGRGFAVVADEVRALAERTSRATREIGKMIKDIQIETKGAVKSMEQGVCQVEAGTMEADLSGQAIRDILNQVHNVAMTINQIATEAEEQSLTTGKISSRIHQITEVVRHTTRGAHESASAASMLSLNAKELQGIVGQFKL